MRLNEIRKKKVQSVYDPVEAAREQLENYKEQGTKVKPNGTLQLFIPRKIESYVTKKERADYVLKDKAKYAYDDEGNMVPHYVNWINSANESLIREGAPIIAGGSSVLSGNNKPTGALLWTSTAKKMPDNTWTSDWNNFILSENKDWQNKIGYLYKVKPMTVVYELDGDIDAKIIYEIFSKLGRSNTALDDPKEWERARELSIENSEMYLIKKDFPWHEIQKHFDCIHHYHFRDSYFSMPFTYGYDAESSCWFSPNQLELLGQVKVYQGDKDDEDEY